MPTTIQIQERTLELLKKIKGETKSSSYDETIKNIIIAKAKKEQSLIQKSLEIIKKRSLVIPMDTKIGEKAAEISIALRLSAIDSLIYTTSLTNNATLVTLDKEVV